MMTSSRQRRGRDRVGRVLEQMAQSGPTLTAGTAHGPLSVAHSGPARRAPTRGRERVG
jgi:hypothetical protein